MEQEEIKDQEGIVSPEEIKTENEPVVIDEQNCSCEGDNKSAKHCHKAYCIARLVFDLLMLAAVITLFVLYAKGRPSKDKVKDNAVAESVVPGNGDILYVNIDSINANYEMVKILTDSIDAEKSKKEVVFQNRQKALENKLRNYQQNMQSGVLNAQQSQYAEASLQQESTQLQSDYEQALASLEARYTAALAQISDSLIAVSKRINEGKNASFIMTYGGGSNMIVADPTRDITDEVLTELNKPFKKK
ncbi:MAG: OmpH family outer membrane protein [Bacteroidales bacterium]|nr:OmpH family outer membrane protein [Bacteroidales bacterium]